ncbi:hypothetical protein LINPERHAP1_LOCUS2056, partial [Linum perenne]
HQQRSSFFPSRRRECRELEEESEAGRWDWESGWTIEGGGLQVPSSSVPLILFQFSLVPCSCLLNRK